HVRLLRPSPSTTETMKRLPLLGQVLGRLCWNPYVTADGEYIYSNIFFSSHNLIKYQTCKVLCRLTTEEDDGATLAMMKHLGVPTREYYVKVLNKVYSDHHVLSFCFPNDTNFNISQTPQRCSCGSIQAASEAFMSLITCAEASPVIGTLLQQPAPCIRGGLSENFIDALHSEEVVISLWCHSLPFLEEAVLSLLDSATAAGSTPDKIKEQVTKSLLPKACAQHCSIFLVVNDIFRTVLKRAERNECVKDFLQTFTKCFLRELTLLQPQVWLLFNLGSYKCDWKNHLMWVSSTLQRLTEEEEEEEGSDAINIRVFEAWFLLAQCAHWVQVAVQLLVTSGPEDCGSLLWLLTFYHRPTNRWHHRAVQAKAAWDQLYSIFSVGAHPLPQLSLITLHLLVSFAVFGQLPLSTSTEITLKVRGFFSLLITFF
uniref:FA complementation group C n=1 Tax=Cyprinodon variegatus TaxID=28743 RepID=A0A3Q2GHW7_CYPVA